MAQLLGQYSLFRSPEANDAGSASIKCGTVEDVRLILAVEAYQALILEIVNHPDESIQRSVTSGDTEKIKVESIEIEEGKVRLNFEDSEIPIEIDTSEAQLNYGLGGGALNSTLDSAMINQKIADIVGNVRVPESQLFLSESALKKSEALQKLIHELPSLKIIALQGQIRRSVFLRCEETTDEDAPQYGFSTRIATIEDEVPPARLPRYIIINNEPNDDVLRDAAKLVHNDSHKGSRFIWCVGKNQVNDGIDNYLEYFNLCETLTLNLDEAVSWLQSASKDTYAKDPIILKSLENEKLPKCPTKRQKLAQGCADLFHQLGVKESVFVTDGSRPTLVSRRGSKKRQYYIPVLAGSELEEMNSTMEAFGVTPKKDTTGAGDSVAATILSLKQISQEAIKPGEIMAITNHISRLICFSPYSNLVEVEANHPGIVRAVMDLAAKNIAKLDRAYFPECGVNLLTDEEKERDRTPFFKATSTAPAQTA